MNTPQTDKDREISDHELFYAILNELKAIRYLLEVGHTFSITMASELSAFSGNYSGEIKAHQRRAPRSKEEIVKELANANQELTEELAKASGKLRDSQHSEIVNLLKTGIADKYNEAIVKYMEYTGVNGAVASVAIQAIYQSLGL